MRKFFVIGLGLTVLSLSACRMRDPVQDGEPDEAHAQVAAEAATADRPVESVSTMDPATMDAMVDEGPIAMQTQVVQRVESLTFAHGTGMCVQAGADGATSLQRCDPNGNGQKFLFARSLDGRVQLKDTSSQLCLAVGPVGFFSATVLRAEVCESKSTQFFSVVDYGTSYSLKFDRFNTCIDAEMGRSEPGTRLILYRCSAVLNQKIQLMAL